jgi:hypothetical protein
MTAQELGNSRITTSPILTQRMCGRRHKVTITVPSYGTPGARIRNHHKQRHTGYHAQSRNPLL